MALALGILSSTINVSSIIKEMTEGNLTVAFCEPVYNRVKFSAFKYLGWKKMKSQNFADRF